MSVVEKSTSGDMAPTIETLFREARRRRRRRIGIAIGVALVLASGVMLGVSFGFWGGGVNQGHPDASGHPPPGSLGLSRAVDHKYRLPQHENLPIQIGFGASFGDDSMQR